MRLLIVLFHQVRRKIIRTCTTIISFWNCSNGIRHGGAVETMTSCENWVMANRMVCLLSALSALPPFLVLFWFSGLADHFYELSFSQFRWPADESGIKINVRTEVVRELLGLPSTPGIRYNHWNNYPVLLSPSCKNNWLTRKRSILVIVKSAPERKEYRTAIRSSYAAVKKIEENTIATCIRTIFVCGRSKDGKTEELEAEANQYGDMLVGDFIDNYFNNTRKFIHAIRFANNHCGTGSIPFVLLLDDDYMLLPWNLASEVLIRHVPNERLYMGWRLNTSPFRNRFSKYRVSRPILPFTFFQLSLDEYPFDAFPPYITAGAVLLSSQTINEFHAAIPYVPPFRFDDVYAGILAHFLAINAQHSANFPANLPILGEFLFTHKTNQIQQSLVASHGFTPTQLRKEYVSIENEWRRNKGTAAAVQKIDD